MNNRAHPEYLDLLRFFQKLDKSEKKKKTFKKSSVLCYRVWLGSSLWSRLNYLIFFIHHHHVTLSARIFLTLSRHTSISSIAFGWSSGLHPVSAQSYCMQVRARPYEGGPQEYITYELVPTSPAVFRVSGSFNFDSFRDGW